MVDLALTARVMEPGAKATPAAVGTVPARAAMVSAMTGRAVRAAGTVSEASVLTGRLATVVEANARPQELGVTDNGRNARQVRAEAESATNGTRAVRARPDHPTALRGVTATVNAADVRTMAQMEIGPLAEVAPGRAQGARTVPDAMVQVPVAPTANVAGRALAAHTATATVRVRDAATETGRVTVAAVSARTAVVHGMVAVHATASAVSVPTVAAPVMLGAVSAPTGAVHVTASAMGARMALVVTVSVQRATATVSVLLARAVHATATGDPDHSVGLVKGNAPSVRSAEAHEGEAESSVAGTGSRDATTGVGATTRAVPIVRAMATATVDAGAMIVAGGTIPCGPATDARLVATAMHEPRKKS